MDKVFEKVDLEELYNFIDLDDTPQINVVDDRTFQKRVATIFNMISNALVKSYGPYGSSSIIINYPYHHMTKDGYSIAKYLTMSKKRNEVDDAIKNLIIGPCTKLNFLVGDGTTTAIVAVNNIYQAYMKEYDNIKEFNLPPRDILNAYKSVTNMIIEKLENYEITKIDTDNHDKMVETISNVAYISSNGDSEVTKLISDMYDELGFPLITVKKAPDGITKSTITKGYHFDMVIRDALYVNNEDRVAKYKNCDVLLFDHVIGMDCYENILKPLAKYSKILGRHLVVSAPSYDNVAMVTISRELMKEYKETHDVGLVLTTCQTSFGNNRDRYDDLAILLNTTIINMGLERLILDNITSNNGSLVLEYIDMNNRNLKGIYVASKRSNPDNKDVPYVLDDGTITDDERMINLKPESIRCGFAGSVELGMENGSVFDDLTYDEELYNKTLDTIQVAYDKSINKNAELGNMDVVSERLQERLFTLKMKLGVIEVGGNSQLSQQVLYDSVIDSVKATESAYRYGVVKGCSTSTLRAALRVLDSFDPDMIEYQICKFIVNGFVSVYKELLYSRYDNVEIENTEPWSSVYNLQLIESMGIRPSTTSNNDVKLSKDIEIDDIFDVIISYSIDSGLPLDITTGNYTPNIINSAKTDIEVLKTSADLIGLLITGNQLIITDHRDYV
jgi:60 kDa chaperonin 2